MSTADPTATPPLLSWPEPVRPDLEQQTPVYPSVGVSTLVSRSWNLLRQTLKPSFLVMLVPSVLDAVNGILLTLPSILPTLTENSGTIVAGALGALLLGMVVGLVNFFIRLIALAGLARLYYATLLQGRVPSLKEAFEPVLQNVLPLVVVTTITCILFMTFITLDTMVMFTGIIGVYVLIILIAAGAAAFAGPAGNNPVTAGIVSVSIILLFVVVAVVLGLAFWGLVSCQMIICFVPLVAVINQLNGSTSVGKAIGMFSNAFALTFRGFSRTVLFGFLLFAFIWVLSLAISLPVQVWYLMEVFFQSQHGPAGTIPPHVAIITSLYSVATSAILWPLAFSGATLFWYDSRAKYEGFDLRIRLHQMAHRVLGRRKAAKQV